MAKVLVVGKSKSPTVTGRAISRNSRILSILEMWAAQFPGRHPAHFVFPSEKYGLRIKQTAKRAGAILKGKKEEGEGDP